MRTVEYKRYRLYFDAEVIEPLDWDDIFRIVTPDGTYEMSKRQFYDTFSNVVKTKSYQEEGVYHYPTTPVKAAQYRVHSN